MVGTLAAVAALRKALLQQLPIELQERSRGNSSSRQFVLRPRQLQQRGETCCRSTSSTMGLPAAADVPLPNAALPSRENAKNCRSPSRRAPQRHPASAIPARPAAAQEQRQQPQSKHQRQPSFQLHQQRNQRLAAKRDYGGLTLFCSSRISRPLANEDSSISTAGSPEATIGAAAAVAEAAAASCCHAGGRKCQRDGSIVAAAAAAAKTAANAADAAATAAAVSIVRAATAAAARGIAAAASALPTPAAADAAVPTERAQRRLKSCGDSSARAANSPGSSSCCWSCSKPEGGAGAFAPLRRSTRRARCIGCNSPWEQQQQHRQQQRRPVSANSGVCRRSRCSKGRRYQSAPPPPCTSSSTSSNQATQQGVLGAVNSEIQRHAGITSEDASGAAAAPTPSTKQEHRHQQEGPKRHRTETPAADALHLKQQMRYEQRLARMRQQLQQQDQQLQQQRGQQPQRRPPWDSGTAPVAASAATARADGAPQSRVAAKLSAAAIDAISAR